MKVGAAHVFDSKGNDSICTREELRRDNPFLKPLRMESLELWTAGGQNDFVSMERVLVRPDKDGMLIVVEALELRGSAHLRCSVCSVVLRLARWKNVLQPDQERVHEVFFALAAVDVIKEALHFLACRCGEVRPQVFDVHEVFDRTHHFEPTSLSDTLVPQADKLLHEVMKLVLRR
jgi:hypothetical protein